MPYAAVSRCTMTVARRTKAFYKARRPFYKARWPFHNARRPFDNARRPFYKARSPFYKARRPFYTTRWPFHNAPRPLSYARRPLHNARWPLHDARLNRARWLSHTPSGQPTRASGRAPPRTLQRRVTLAKVAAIASCFSRKSCGLANVITLSCKGRLPCRPHFGTEAAATDV